MKRKLLFFFFLFFYFYTLFFFICKRKRNETNAAEMKSKCKKKWQGENEIKTENRLSAQTLAKMGPQKERETVR